MAYRIERHSVEEEQIVMTGATVDMQTGYEFRAGRYSRKGLQRLYHIGRAQYCESFVKSLPVHPFQTRQRRTDLLLMPAGDDSGFRKCVVPVLLGGICQHYGFLRSGQNDMAVLFDCPDDT